MKQQLLTLSVVVLGTLASAQAAADSDNSLATGSLQSAFSSWGKPSVEGDWKIVEQDGTHYIELSENFRAKKGPDVKIFLSPTPAAQVTGTNAVNGSVLVKQIDDFDGQARIALPAGTDLSQFQSLVFHCEAFSKLWGSSALR
ncbi:MAG: DM13 domain-containing protein [Pseudomonadota bacterium]